MSVVVLFHTNDVWTKHRIIWSGHFIASGISLFNDSFSANIAGQHSSPLPTYADFGQSVTVTRLDTTAGNLAIAGSSPSGIPYSLIGPTTTRPGGKLANYLDEFSTALGSVYIETSTKASGTINDYAGDIFWYPGYPPSGTPWVQASGIGYAQNDVIGLDYPDNARILISSPELANASGTANPGVEVINIASGAGQDLRYGTLYHPDIPTNIQITDIEAQRILG
jgi:hypothetical protein